MVLLSFKTNVLLILLPQYESEIIIIKYFQYLFIDYRYVFMASKKKLEKKKHVKKYKHNFWRGGRRKKNEEEKEETRHIFYFRKKIDIFIFIFQLQFIKGPNVM